MTERHEHEFIPEDNRLFNRLSMILQLNRNLSIAYGAMGLILSIALYFVQRDVASLILFIVLHVLWILIGVNTPSIKQHVFGIINETGRDIEHAIGMMEAMNRALDRSTVLFGLVTFVLVIGMYFA
ncbi:MAG: hypothetical protein ACOYLB_11820 [Phototrophicaceae bacterium]